MLADFYRKSELELYIDPMQFHVMTETELAQHIADGIRLYKSMFPPDKGLNPLMIVAVVVVAVAAVAAVAAAGSAAAGGSAAASASGAAAASAAAPGVATVAATAGAAPASVLSTVQSVAGYVSGAGKVYAVATGKNPPEKLMAAADIVGSPSLSGAVKSGVNYQLKQEGLEVAKDDANAQAALDVMVQREQAKYAAQLRQQAELEAERLSLPPPEPPQKLGLKDALPFVVPLAIAALVG